MARKHLAPSRLTPLLCLVTLTVGYVCLPGCYGRCDWNPPPERVGAHPNPHGAIAACKLAFQTAPKKPLQERVEVLAAACGKLFSAPKCAEVWPRLARSKSSDEMLQVLDICQCAYCAKLAKKRNKFCASHCRSGKPVKKPPLLDHEFEEGRAYWRAIMDHELGSSYPLKVQVGTLIHGFFGEWLELSRAKIKDEPEVTPRLSSLRRNLRLNLTLVMTDQGYILKSRHGLECPPSRKVRPGKVCFPTYNSRYDDNTIQLLRHHLWYLFAKKYRDPKHYLDPANRHNLVIVPEPTIRYDDIVRTMDAVREIPRDATNPKVGHTIPAGGCSVRRDAKTNRWVLSKPDGVSVLRTACMYHRITLALGTL
ncbi:MAG: hypothetical protein ABI333_03110 [bacterium]